MATGIHNLSPNPGSTHRKKRVGRGIGSGHGKTSTRGHKGDKSRGGVNPNFEGGQTPLHRRLPHLRGQPSRTPNQFTKIRDRSYALVNLYVLEENFEAGATITPEMLVERGLLRDFPNGLKVLGDGELTKQLTIQAHKFSKSAEEKLNAAGCTVETLPSIRRGKK
jgi:large subunit ribosomal protein L15